MHKPPGNAAPWVRTRVACTAAILTIALTAAGHRASAQTDVPPERRAAREWYQDARFGMFIHWGVYSLLGDGEWVMQNRKITVPEYEWLATTFNPVKFDAKAWVSLARAAGMRVHHDHVAPSRWLLDVQDRCDAIQHRGLDAIPS